MKKIVLHFDEKNWKEKKYLNSNIYLSNENINWRGVGWIDLLRDIFPSQPSLLVKKLFSFSLAEWLTPYGYSYRQCSGRGMTNDSCAGESLLALGCTCLRFPFPFSAIALRRVPIYWSRGPHTCSMSTLFPFHTAITSVFRS